MLILTRVRNQRIFIGDNIVITLVSVHGERVRIGIDAPPDVRVDREEVRDRIEREGPWRYP